MAQTIDYDPWMVVYNMSITQYEHSNVLSLNFQISDFGLSRSLTDENCYISHGGKIPVKWTAPEVEFSYIPKVLCVPTIPIVLLQLVCWIMHAVSIHYRPFTTKNIPVPVMCGALAV